MMTTSSTTHEWLERIPVQQLKPCTKVHSLGLACWDNQHQSTPPPAGVVIRYGDRIAHQWYSPAHRRFDGNVTGGGTIVR